MGILGRNNESCLGASILRRVTTLLLAAAFCAGCHRMRPAQLQPLYDSGMAYDTVTRLTTLKITPSEVPQIVQARQSGFSDTGCVAILEIYRSRNQSFDAGAAIAGLTGAGASESLVLKLAALNQLGLGAGELQAMRLAGLSDDILLAVAQHHAAGRPVLSGASLAGLKNLGMGSRTLFELAERGVPDSRAAEIMKMRRRGAKDAQILHDFDGS
ncbi:MAG TPA: hypothetical protein VJN69_15195 [Candidatus Acidoferrales bacterium]|nr:hypothetical protein [Candidatus Acidoferrales bacterium]